MNKNHFSPDSIERVLRVKSPLSRRTRQSRDWVLNDTKPIWRRNIDQTERVQGTKLTFLARSHLAPKFSKVVAKAKKLGAIKKKKKR